MMVNKKPKVYLRFLLFVLLLAGSLYSRAQSVLQSGNWYKVAVNERGVYKISAEQFSNMGFGSGVNPKKIRIYGNKGGLVPQALSETRPVDLVENAIYVHGEADGVFNSSDYILFYAEGADGITYNETRGIFHYQHNFYEDKNYYFITVSTDDGKRIGSTENVAGTFPIVKKFDDFVFHEVDQYSELESGREWFGEKFDLTTSYTFDLNLSNIVSSGTVKVVSDVMAQAFSSSTFTMSLNGIDIGTHTIASIPDSQYEIKGRHDRDTLSIQASTLSGPALELKYQYNKAASGRSIGYLNYFLVQATRALRVYNNHTIFTMPANTEQAITTYQIEAASTNTRLWDVTVPDQVNEQEFILNADEISFTTASSSLKTFVVFSEPLTVEFIGKVSNQNLHGLGSTDFIIISHPDFITEAQRLAAHRQQYLGYNNIVVVTPQEIYNEFSSGRQDVSAIRDFIKHVYDASGSALKAVLMFGRGSYDYKNRVSNNTNFVPVYESRNSLDPLETYSSDDFFGFMEVNEGNWGEGSAIQHHTMDVGVGRLPVKSLSEAKNVVDKIIAYDQHNAKQGHWQKSIVFVADDGSISDGFTSIHQSQASTLAEYIEENYPEYNQRKIFLGTYEKTVKVGSETIPEVNDRMMVEFDNALVINYTGHGSERILADERIFTENEINDLNNTRYPFLVTATCEFGRNDDPFQISSAEETILRPAGGSIGLVTTARPVYSFSNFELNKAFYEAFFLRSEGRPLWLGEIFRQTKNNSTSGVGNRNFSLLADPSMTLLMPLHKVTVTQLQTTSGSATLKALSTVVLKGEVQDNTDQRLEDFNGFVEVTLFDKRTNYVTIGKNNPAYSFSQWSNVLFRGKATVKDGEFELTFTLPKNMSYQVSAGKLSLLAVDTVSFQDASGAYTNFEIGGTEDVTTDTNAPEIKVYMGDTTFKNGGMISPNSTLLVRLTDADGINISNYGIGNVTTASLDNDAEVFALNDFYMADQDDATSGWIRYPLYNLEPGEHRITVRAWDLFNNPVQATITFFVTDGSELIIESLAGYPNPFSGTTALIFTHNRSGDDLEGAVTLYRSTGEEIESRQFTVQDSPYQVNLSEILDFLSVEKKLAAGLYLARVSVRSLSNGSKNERVARLIAVH